MKDTPAPLVTLLRSLIGKYKGIEISLISNEIVKGEVISVTEDLLTIRTGIHFPRPLNRSPSLEYMDYSPSRDRSSWHTYIPMKNVVYVKMDHGVRAEEHYEDLKRKHPEKFMSSL